jgi:hypothetical protein
VGWQWQAALLQRARDALQPLELLLVELGGDLLLRPLPFLLLLLLAWPLLLLLLLPLLLLLLPLLLLPLLLPLVWPLLLVRQLLLLLLLLARLLHRFAGVHLVGLDAGEPQLVGQRQDVLHLGCSACKQGGPGVTASSWPRLQLPALHGEQCRLGCRRPLLPSVPQPLPTKPPLSPHAPTAHLGVAPVQRHHLAAVAHQLRNQRGLAARRRAHVQHAGARLRRQRQRGRDAGQVLQHDAALQLACARAAAASSISC